MNGHAEIAKVLLENGATADLHNDKDWTSLYYASGRGHAEVAIILLEYGAQVDLQRDGGCSALLLASIKGNLEVARILLDEGAKVNMPSESGLTALMLASRFGNAEVTKLLLENGAEINMQDHKQKWSALMQASANGHAEVATILLDHGASLNQQGTVGHSALMLASSSGHTEVVKILLDERAEVDLQSQKGYSALMLASGKGHAEVVKLILEEGGKVDLQNFSGFSALMIASQKGHIQVAELLLQNRAQINLRNKERHSSLELAHKYNNLKVFELLLQNINDNIRELQQPTDKTEIISSNQNEVQKYEDNAINSSPSKYHKSAEKSNEEENWIKMKQLQRRIEETEGRAEVLEIMALRIRDRVQESWRTKEEFDRKAEQLQRIVEESEVREQELDRRILELLQRIEESEKRAEDSDTRAQQLQREVEESDRRNKQLKEEYDEQWVIKREEINLTGPEIGRGGWAKVSIAEFRGVQVAVKEIYDQIISDRNKELFRREMNMAARLRHPNLVQFIGATIQGDMMILMEFMPTSLRKQLEKGLRLTEEIIKYLSLDVAKGLNYLHLIKPDPMIHRDISSANVLLEPSLEPKHCKAKITDYGSVNLLNKLNTKNPGSPAYSAPEAYSTSDQSPKMDIYSFGALILEMLTNKMPYPDIRHTLFQEVDNKKYSDMIKKCLSENRFDRPTASDIIAELSLNSHD